MITYSVNHRYNLNSFRIQNPQAKLFKKYQKTEMLGKKLKFIFAYKSNDTMPLARYVKPSVNSVN